MNEEAVEPQIEAEPIEQIVEEAIAEQQPEEIQDEKPEKTMIPLSVAQKLREQKRELELELQWEKQERLRMQSQPQTPPEDDNSRFESATKDDLNKSQDEVMRNIEERLWIRGNREKYEFVNENLPKFLKQRPNFASAIAQSENRYEEAYTLMEALSAKEQQKELKRNSQPAKKQAPNAPTSIPKAAIMNDNVDVMTMSDKEFSDWRQSKKQRR